MHNGVLGKSHRHCWQIWRALICARWIRQFRGWPSRSLAEIAKVGGAEVMVLCGLIFLAPTLGCVERRLTVRTDPPGARVYIDDYEIGTSPCSTHFTYYGTRKIRLVKDGFRTKTIYQPVAPPWYQIPPIDFFAEVVVPAKIRDHRTLSYQLEPEVIVPADELRRRAEGLREYVSREAGTYVVPADRVAQPLLPGSSSGDSMPLPAGDITNPVGPGRGRGGIPWELTPGPMPPAEVAPGYLGR